MGREWCCSTCEAVLGVERNGRMFVRALGAQFAVRGEVVTACRDCGALNEITVPSAQEPPRQSVA